jgi:hypothetical protein
MIIYGEYLLYITFNFSTKPWMINKFWALHPWCCATCSYLRLNTSMTSSASFLHSDHLLVVNTGPAFYTTTPSTSRGIYHFNFVQTSSSTSTIGVFAPTSQASLQPTAMALTEEEMYAIQATERIASVLSLLGAAFVISTFAFNKNFHKPINRLVFYACFGNVMANIGTIISTSGEILGSDSTLCQFQGFLIQMYDHQTDRGRLADPV